MPQGLHRDEFQLLFNLWPSYFEFEASQAKDGEAPVLEDRDPRLAIISAFRETFEGAAGAALVKGANLSQATSVLLDFDDLCAAAPVPDLAEQLFEQPRPTLACLGLSLCLLRHGRHPELRPPLTRIEARIANAQPRVEIGELRSQLVGRFVTLSGNVVRASSISPLVLEADFECSKCSSIMPRAFVDGKFNPPTSCVGSNCKARTFELLRDTAVTVDYQRLKLQEVESDASEPGRMPRTVDVELSTDLVDLCIPGDVVTVSGVVKSVNAELASGRTSKRAKASGLFLLYISANSLVNTRRDNSAAGNGASAEAADKARVHFSRRDLLSIREVAESAAPFELVVASLCQGIYGHDVVKAGLTLALLGGTARDTEVATRSDIHLLMVGDPGLGKSQMLRATSQAAPRSVYVCGNTTSTTGLTVTVCKEAGGSGGDVGLEAGALVLSDQGVCCIDEFDKMACDPHALLEAMEQQQISIAKAGVVASLPSRCSVVAAANPTGGHYNRSKTVAENVKMNSALLSRFDLIFILLDKPDERHDKKLSDHIMRLHHLTAADAAAAAAAAAGGGSSGSGGSSSGGGGSSGGSSGDGSGGGGFVSAAAAAAGAWGGGAEGGRRCALQDRLRTAAAQMGGNLMPQELLRKYIAYARTYAAPRLTLAAARVLQKLYVTMRSEAEVGRSMPITTRQLESLVRLSQARAKAELREEVTEADARDVVDLMHESLVQAYMDEGGNIDFGHGGGGAGSGGRMSRTKQIKAFVAAMDKQANHQGSAAFSHGELLALANQMCLAISDFDGFLDTLRSECYLLKKGPRMYELQVSNYAGGGASQTAWDEQVRNDAAVAAAANEAAASPRGGSGGSARGRKRSRTQGASQRSQSQAHGGGGAAADAWAQRELQFSAD